MVVAGDQEVHQELGLDEGGDDTIFGGVEYGFAERWGERVPKYIAPGFLDHSAVSVRGQQRGRFGFPRWFIGEDDSIEFRDFSGFGGREVFWEEEEVNGRGQE